MLQTWVKPHFQWMFPTLDNEMQGTRKLHIIHNNLCRNQIIYINSGLKNVKVVFAVVMQLKQHTEKKKKKKNLDRIPTHDLCYQVLCQVLWLYVWVCGSKSVTIQMGDIEQYFAVHVALFIMLCKVVLTFESEDEIFKGALYRYWLEVNAMAPRLSLYKVRNCLRIKRNPKIMV